MTTLITNEVLSERQSQQHTQIMAILSRIDSKLAALSGSVHKAQIVNAEQELRIAGVEEHLTKVDDTLVAMQKQMWKVVVATALLAGAGMAGVSEALKILL